MSRPRWAVAVISGSIVLAACGSSTDSQLAGAAGSVTEQASGDRLPSVEITGLASGETSDLSDIEGPAVVNLWATWCAPCRAEIPDFEEVHQARSDEVRFVGINIGENAGTALSFIDEVGASYDQFADVTGDVSIELRATSMPVTIVIDEDGVITTRHLGPLDQDGLNEAIDGALARS